VALKAPITVVATTMYGSVHFMCACTGIGPELHSGILQSDTFFCCPNCGQAYRLILDD
jgi:predicted RNA-binding Zn-ribbon protein involved in translation (DUF1610 family)